MTAATPADGVSVLRTLRESPAPVWVVLAGTFINRLGAFVQVFLVLFLTSEGLSAAEAGLALGAYGVGSVVGVAAGGSLTDRLGHRWTIVSSMVATGALTVALVYARPVPLVLGLAALVGGTAQVYRPASAALLASLTPDSRHVMIFAVYRLAFNVGMTIGPLLGVLLIQIGYDVLFVADAITSILFAGLAAALLPRDHPGAARAAGPTDGSREDRAALPQTGSTGYRAVLADRRFSLFLLALLLNALVYVQYLSALPLEVTGRGYSTGVFGALVAFNGFVVIACELPLTHLVQHWAARWAVGVGVGLVGAGLALYALPLGIAGLVVATLIWSLGEIIGTPTASAYPARVAPPHLQGRYLAALATAQSIGYAVGPPLGLALFSWAGGDAVWVACALVTVVAVLAVVAGVDRRDPADTRAPAPAVEPVVGPDPDPAAGARGADKEDHEAGRASG